MAPRRCCCDETCVICQDDFNRPDSDTLGPLWQEVSGDADVVGFTGEVITDGLFIVTCRQRRPTIAGRRYNLRWTIDCVEGKSEYSIICHYIDSLNYYWIRITEHGDGFWYPEFMQTVGGVDNILHCKDVGLCGDPYPQTGGFSFAAGIMRIAICYASVEWSVQWLGSETQWVFCGGGASSLPASGLGLVGFRAGHFDNADYQIHWESDPDCFSCTCFCQISNTDYLCLPQQMTLTLYPVGAAWIGCDPPLTLTATLYQQIPDNTGLSPLFGVDYKTAQKRHWYTPLIIGEDTITPTPLHENLWAVLVCDNARDRVYLTFMCYPQRINPAVPATGCGSSGYGQFQTPDGTIPQPNSRYFEIASSTCDPLNLVFDLIDFPRSAMNQCATIGGVPGPGLYGVNGTTYRPVITV